MRDVDQAAGKITGVSGTESGVGKTFAVTTNSGNVLEDG